MAAVDFGYATGTGTGWGMDISAGGGPLEMTTGGVSIAWDTVAPLGAPLTLNEGIVVPAGEKILTAGQILLEITTGANIRMFGPFDPAAADGRQTLAAGTNCGIVRRTIIYQPLERNRLYDAFLGLVIGGRVIRDMILATTGAASLAAGPTWAALYAALPRVVYIVNLRAAHT